VPAANAPEMNDPIAIAMAEVLMVEFMIC